MSKNQIVYQKYTNTQIVPKNLSSACHKLRHDLCKLFDKEGWVAGGKLRSSLADNTESDYDCYFPSQIHLENSILKIKRSNTLNAKKTIEDEFLVSFKTSIGKIDLVKKYFETPADTLEDFDFTLVCFSLDNHGTVWWLPRAIGDLARKELILFNPSCPLSTQVRVSKYIAKGYKIELEEQIKLAKMMQERKIDGTIDKLRTRNHEYFEGSKDLEIKLV